MISFLLFLRKPPFNFHSIGDEHIYRQKLDHFDINNDARFDQRFYVNNTFANSSINPPRLIVYIGGESELTEKSVISGSYIDLANQTQSYVVSLEHRFFGKSMPFTELTTENLRYLTSDQALADLAEFISWYKEYKFSDVEPTVLVVGGSYPGTLSSYFRLKYPHLANYSWASSPPLYVKNEFYEYDEHCAKVLKERDERCYENTKIIYDYFNENAGELQTLIKFTKSTDEDAHLSIIADFIAGIVQYDNTYRLLDEYCEGMKLEANKDHFIAMFEKYLEKSGIENPDDLDDTLNTNISVESDNADSRSWTWMTCNEFGWYQVASGKLRPARVNLDYSNRICQLYFNVSVAKNLQAKEYIYGGRTPKSSMVYFTNGNTDPWSTLSVYDNISDQTVGRYSVHIEGASHCSDLHSFKEEDSDDLKIKRHDIMKVMIGWLSGSSDLCKHGNFIMGQCVCNEGYFGDQCQLKHVTNTLFRVFTTLVVVLPTIMMIIIGCSAWCLFKKDRDDSDIRTIP